MAERVRIRFWGDDQLIVQTRSGWRILGWPNADQLRQGGGRIFPDPNGERAIVLDGGQVSWLDGQPFPGVPSDLAPSDIAWDGSDALLLTVHSAGARQQEDAGATAEVYGSARPEGMSLWRVPLEGIDPTQLIQVPVGESLRNPVALSEGIAFEHWAGPANDKDLSWRIRVVDRKGGDSRELLPECPGLLGDLSRSPTDSRLAFMSSNPPLPYWWEPCIYEGGKVTKPLPEDMRAGVPVWAPHGRTLVATCFDGIRVGAVEFVADGSDWHWLAEPDGQCYCVEIAPDGKSAVMAWSGIDTPISLIRIDEGERTSLVEIAPAPQRQSVRRLVSWRAGSVELEGILDTPREGSPPWPTVVDLHGGPDYSMKIDLPNNLIPLDWWCEHGLAVFAPAHRGSGLAGKKARSVSARFTADEDSGSEWRDVLAGVDALVAEGVCDPSKLFLFGFSHGAWLAGRILAEDHRFQAAATWEGYGVDFALEYGMLGGNPMVRFLFGGDPWQVPEHYENASLLHYIDQMRTPLMLLSGDRNNVGAYTAKMMYTALKAHGQETRLVLYPGEEHVPLSEHNLLDITRRCVDWFNSGAASESASSK